MATFERIDPNGDLNTGKSVFYVTDSLDEQVQLSQQEAEDLMEWLRSFLDPLPSLYRKQEREKTLRQIVEGLLLIAEPGNVKNTLWARYQGLDAKE